MSTLLKPLDSVFLAVEEDENLMNIGGLYVYPSNKLTNYNLHFDCKYFTTKPMQNETCRYIFNDESLPKPEDVKQQMLDFVQFLGKTSRLNSKIHTTASLFDQPKWVRDDDFHMDNHFSTVHVRARSFIHICIPFFIFFIHFFLHLYHPLFVLLFLHLIRSYISSCHSLIPSFILFINAFIFILNRLFISPSL